MNYHRAATVHVEWRRVASVFDETPRVYQPIGKAVQVQANLVEITHTLRQAGFVKG